MIVETIIQAIGGSTKGVRVHLSTHHRGEWKELEENEKLKNNEKEKDKKMERKEQPTIRGHEMFHDDMIMYVIINDQQPFMAMINISSV